MKRVIGKNKPWNPLANMDLFSFLESHLSQFGLHFLGTLFVIGYFAWSLTWHKMPRKKFPNHACRWASLWLSLQFYHLKGFKKIQPSKSFRFIVCYFSPVEVVEVALLFARWWTGILQNSMCIVSTPNLSGVTDFQIFQKCWKKKTDSE